LALRQQTLVLRRDHPKPPFSTWGAAFWVLPYRYWQQWRRPLALVKPETVIAWHLCLLPGISERPKTKSVVTAIPFIPATSMHKKTDPPACLKTEKIPPTKEWLLGCNPKREF